MCYRILLFHLMFFLILLAPASKSNASEFVGLHSQGMGGAHRGLGTSNDTLFLNPAGMSMSKRYTIEASTARDLYDDAVIWALSAVDSKSGPLAGGLGWMMERKTVDDETLVINRFILGISLAPMEFLSIGFNTNYFSGEAQPLKTKFSDLSLFSGDLGVGIKFLESFRLGFATKNIFSSDESEYLPMTTGCGFGFVSNRINIAADLVWNKDVPENESLSYHAGLEYFAEDVFPFRLGYRRSPFHKKDDSLSYENHLSGGLGWVSMTGSLEFSYEQSIERPRRKGFSFALKFFL